ncbi:MAG: ribosome maturation factor RimP [Clostridiales bacterium]|nr:ribosome maturation factor RimP [Clostridiales bacterium]
MSKREDYEARTEELILPILTEHAFELVDVEYVREGSNYFLRAYIDKPGGITIDDCELVSRALSDRLDAEDFIPDSYILEVSSPGLGRPLKKEKDLQRSIGEEVEVKLYKGIPSQVGKKTVAVKEWTGILAAYDEENLELELEDGETLKLDRSNVALIRLAVTF